MFTLRGIVIDLIAEEENADDSICLSRESCSNEIDESDLQLKKHDEQKISILQGIVTFMSQPKYRINFEPDESRRNDDTTKKCECSDSIKIEMCEIP
jgi:hypothetical protein